LARAVSVEGACRRYGAGPHAIQCPALEERGHMSRLRYGVDPPFSSAWVVKVGKLILSFGALEFETYLWLVELSEAPERIPQFCRLRFAERVQRVMELIDTRACSAKLKAEAQKCWNEALDHARFRNRIAHSPLMFGWNTEEHVGEPDFIGIVDLQRRDSSVNPLASKAEMNGVVNSIVSLAARLASLRTDWSLIRDAEHGSITTE
jgi:hypothetical protein